jgi:hypothetical protein
MNAPIPRVWFGLAFLVAVAAAFVITQTFDNWSQLVPVPESVPLGTRRVLLTLELTVVGFAVEAIWWLARNRIRTRAETNAPAR